MARTRERMMYANVCQEVAYASLKGVIPACLRSASEVEHGPEAATPERSLRVLVPVAGLCLRCQGVEMCFLVASR